MEQFRRLASKYNGSKPKLDPLVAKQLESSADKSPGRNMHFDRGSASSVSEISVEYNEGSVVAQRQ